MAIKARIRADWIFKIVTICISSINRGIAMKINATAGHEVWAGVNAIDICDFHELH